MPVSPLRPRLQTTSAPAGPARPAHKPAPAGRTNVARLSGENIRYAAGGGYWGVDMKYLQADLIDLTPDDPLSIWAFGTYKIKVQSGLIQLREDQANRMAKSLVWNQGYRFPLQRPEVQYLSKNRVKLKAQAKWKRLKLPVSLTARLDLTSPSTVAAKPTSVRVLGIPVLWAARLFNIDLASKLPLPKDGPATMGKDYTLVVDLKKTGLFEGELKSLSVSQGRLDVKIGGEAGPSLKGARTDGQPNYAEVIAEGEVALESAILRDASVVIVDETPEDPYAVNFWDTQGYAKIESGNVILDEARLTKKFMSGSDAFKLSRAKLDGQDMHVHGTYNFLFLKLPLEFKLRFSVEDGKLKLTPHALYIVGFKSGPERLMDTLKAIPGATMSPKGDGVLLDLRAASSVQMGKIRRIKTEPGRLVLQK